MEKKGWDRIGQDYMRQKKIGKAGEDSVEWNKI